MHADPDKPATDCLWLYLTGKLVGAMQQLVVMKAAMSNGKDKDYVLAPHGYASHA